MALAIEYENSVIATLYAVKRNELLMLRDRGTVDEGTLDQYNFLLEDDFTLSDFIVYYTSISEREGITLREAMTTTYELKDTMKFLYVVYMETPSGNKSISNTSTSKIISTINTGKDGKIASAIIISEFKLSHTAARNIRSARQLKNIETFVYSELVFNHMQHMFSPKYRIMSSEEATELLRATNVKFSDMRRLLVDSPTARWLGVESGQMLEVTRTNFQTNSMTRYPIEYLAVVADHGLDPGSIMTSDSIAEYLSEVFGDDLDMDDGDF